MLMLNSGDLFLGERLALAPRRERGTQHQKSMILPHDPNNGAGAVAPAASCSPSSLDAITAACEEAVERGELKKLPNGKYLSPSGWKSIAVWPKPAVNLMSEDNSSTDNHHSKEAAEAVCRFLRREGFGGDRKIFPLETRVEAIFPENGEHVHPLPAIGEDELGVMIQITINAANTAAGSGLHDADCCAFFSLYSCPV